MSEQRNGKIRFVMVELEGSDQTVAAALATISNLIGHNRQRTTDNGQTLPAIPSTPALPRATDAPAELPEPVQDRGLASPVGGERHADADTQRSVPRRKRRTPSAPASNAPPAQASNIPASSGVQEKTHADGRKLRKDATLLECSDRPGLALTIQEIATKTGYPVGTIRGWLTKAGREWFAIDHLKYRRMVTDED